MAGLAAPASAFPCSVMSVTALLQRENLNTGMFGFDRGKIINLCRSRFQMPVQQFYSKRSIHGIVYYASSRTTSLYIL